MSQIIFCINGNVSCLCHLFSSVSYTCISNIADIEMCVFVVGGVGCGFYFTASSNNKGYIFANYQ